MKTRKTKPYGRPRRNNTDSRSEDVQCKTGRSPTSEQNRRPQQRVLVQNRTVARVGAKSTPAVKTTNTNPCSRPRRSNTDSRSQDLQYNTVRPTTSEQHRPRGNAVHYKTARSPTSKLNRSRSQDFQFKPYARSRRTNIDARSKQSPTPEQSRLPQQRLSVQNPTVAHVGARSAPRSKDVQYNPYGRPRRSKIAPRSKDIKYKTARSLTSEQNRLPQ